jgi:hypothetical protein
MLSTQLSASSSSSLTESQRDNLANKQIRGNKEEIINKQKANDSNVKIQLSNKSVRSSTPTTTPLASPSSSSSNLNLTGQRRAQSSNIQTIQKENEIDSNKTLSLNKENLNSGLNKNKSSTIASPKLSNLSFPLDTDSDSETSSSMSSLFNEQSNKKSGKLYLLLLKQSNKSRISV